MPPGGPFDPIPKLPFESRVFYERVLTFKKFAHMCWCFIVLAAFVKAAFGFKWQFIP